MQTSYPHQSAARISRAMRRELIQARPPQGPRRDRGPWRLSGSLSAHIRTTAAAILEFLVAFVVIFVLPLLLLVTISPR